MVKRIKKPPVKPEKRLEWLRRYEEGELPPKIADSDDFDVRTVRKHIELAKQEREAHEARSHVLRNALESHYQDLCKFAEDLDSEIVEERITSSSLRDSRMWSALRQHLPRSSLWVKLGRWDHVLEEISKLEDDVRGKLKHEIERDSRLSKILAAGVKGFIPGMVEALIFQIKSWAREREGLNIRDNFEVKPAGEGFANVNYGAFNMNKVEDKHVAPIKEAVIDFESKIADWEDYKNMQRLFMELERLKLALRDELAIITLRRVVPGRCKYCPA